jgi:hypothetical protein
MTNHLTKTSGSVSIPQGNQVVGDPDESPVCLNSIPGTHKDLAKSEVLLDVLVEGFDPDPLKIQRDHLRFGHLEIVGDKKPDTVLPGSGNKQKHSADLGQMDLELGHTKVFLFGNTDRFVFSRSLGQGAEGDLLSVDFHKTISFYRSYKCPPCLNNKVENSGTGIPGVHQNRGLDRQSLNGLGKDLDGQLDFAFEGPGFASPLGTISPDCPAETLRTDFENARDSAKPLDEAIGAVMNPKPLDLFPLSWTRSIVEDQERVFPGTSCGYLATIFALKLSDFLQRGRHELMKAIGVLLAVLRGNLPNRTEFYKPDQADKVDQQINPLRLGNGSQEIRETRRNFSGNISSHGFRALLGLVSKGDFGRKPFFLNQLSSLIA